MASLVAITEHGQTIEIATVGSEGFIGVPIVHAVGITPYRVIVQMPTEAARIEPHHLIDQFNRGGKLRELLSHYAHVLEIQMIQSLVCHLFHNVSQRLCRYLLVTANSALMMSSGTTYLFQTSPPRVIMNGDERIHQTH